jgi:hypothetical protein
VGLEHLDVVHVGLPVLDVAAVIACKQTVRVTKVWAIIVLFGSFKGLEFERLK